MAIPLLFFPFSFLSALISVTVPEISRLKALKNKDALKERTSKILTYAWMFSICAGGLFFLFPDTFSLAFYRTDEAARAIRILAAVTPMMYIETITDGMLKSIGEQMWTFMTGLINSALRIIAVLTILSRTGAEGYLWLLVVSNVFSYAMCAYRMKKKAGSAPKLFKGIILPLICCALGGIAAMGIKEYALGIYPQAVCVTLTYLSIAAAVYFSVNKLWKIYAA
jgi:stage V sporulation protein B